MNVPDKNKDFMALAFGEVMLRLSPDGSERVTQSNVFVKYAAGSEMNVMSGIARMNHRTGIITKLPQTMAGNFVRNQIRSYGVSDDYIIRDSSGNARLGLYYYESGAFPRKPTVEYDRDNSSFTTISMNEISDNIFGTTALFHTSGISLALGQGPQSVAIELMKGYKKAGALVSFDVNFRASLWDEDEARRVIEQVLPYIDILFVSEETSRRMFKRSGTMEEIMRGFCEQYGISVVASTQRIINSPRSHSFGSLLYAHDKGQIYSEDPYENIDVVDRIGSGDAYVAGVLSVILSQGGYEKAVSYGNAMSSLKNTMLGDLIATTPAEIENIIKDHHSNGVKSEMNR